MKNTSRTECYPPLEERINILSHAAGLGLSIIALVLLVLRASLHGDAWHVFSFSLFGISLITLYTASTIYHSRKQADSRRRWRIVDHASIYVLIAGSYTPFCLVTLDGPVGWSIFAISWGMALTGITLKLFFTGRYRLLSTLMYVFMGWLIVFAIGPLLENLASDGLYWLIAGGLAYTFGAVIYGIKKISYNHAIFHIFVLLGSFCHFMSIYFYVLPVFQEPVAHVTVSSYFVITL